MKKCLILLLFVLLSGCKQIQEGANDIKDSINKYNDGIYTTKVQGYGGEYDVSVTYQDDRIKDVTIGENNETPSIGGVAVEQIAKNVVDQNTIELDGISGATISSDALLEGLKTIEQQARKAHE